MGKKRGGGGETEKDKTQTEEKPIRFDPSSLSYFFQTSGIKPSFKAATFVTSFIVKLDTRARARAPDLNAGIANILLKNPAFDEVRLSR